MTPKRLVSIIAVVIVLCSATVLVIDVTQIGFAKIVRQGIRFGLTCLLAYSLIKGWNPGRWITIVLMGLAAILSILSGIGVMAESISGIGLLILGLVYGACVVGLLTPFAKTHFTHKPGVEQVGAADG